jgi:hypothetical protein
MDTLFNLAEYEGKPISFVKDPYWDELIQEDSVTVIEDGDFIDDSVTEDSVTTDNNSVTEFEVDGIYWHKEKKVKFKITKLFKTVPKCDGYFAGDPFLVKNIPLDDLVTELPVVTELSVTELEDIELEDIELDEIEDSVTGVNIYKPKGKAKGDRSYYRYSYRDGRRVKHIHIPGGNTNCDIAQQRAKKVREAIAAGAKSPEVISLITSFKQ